MRIGLESSTFFFIAQFLCGRPIFKFSFACKLEVGLGGSRILRKIEVFFFCVCGLCCVGVCKECGHGWCFIGVIKQHIRCLILGVIPRKKRLKKWGIYVNLFLWGQFL